MGMVVRTNIMAMNANRQLGLNNKKVASSLEKLSSGFKINRAADDASGLAISEKMKAQIKGLDQASANSQDGINLIQTAEGATTQIHSMLNRMVELATKSASGTIQDDVDREAIQNEVNDLNKEISRVAQATDFNGIKLLDGSLSKKDSIAAQVEISNVTTTTTAAVKGKYENNTAVTASVAAAGDISKHTFTLDNGKSYTVELAMTVDKEGNFSLVDQDGNATAVSSNGLQQAELDSAILTSLKQQMGSQFDITSAAGVFTFESKVAGTTAPKIASYGYSEKVGGAWSGSATASNITEVTAAEDVKVGVADSAITAYDGTNEKNATFSINGKKFVVALNNTDLSTFSSDVTVLFGAGANNKAIANSAFNSSANRQIIEQTTGLTVEANAAGAGGAGLQLDVIAKANGTGSGLKLQIGDTAKSYNKVAVSIDNLTAEGIGTAGVDVSTQDAAGASIDIIKSAINKVSTNRANLGSLQNRLEYTIENLDNTSENISSANSSIRDTDMAKEMMNYTKMGVLAQAAQAMLAQANQQPQNALNLLQ